MPAGRNGGHQQRPQGVAEGGLGPDPGRVAGGLVGQLQDLAGRSTPRSRPRPAAPGRRQPRPARARRRRPARPCGPGRRPGSRAVRRRARTAARPTRPPGSRPGPLGGPLAGQAGQAHGGSSGSAWPRRRPGDLEGGPGVLGLGQAVDQRLGPGSARAAVLASSAGSRPVSSSRSVPVAAIRSAAASCSARAASTLTATSRCSAAGRARSRAGRAVPVARPIRWAVAWPVRVARRSWSALAASTAQVGGAGVVGPFLLGLDLVEQVRRPLQQLGQQLGRAACPMVRSRRLGRPHLVQRPGDGAVQQLVVAPRPEPLLLGVGGQEGPGVVGQRLLEAPAVQAGRTR